MGRRALWGTRSSTDSEPRSVALEMPGLRTNRPLMNSSLALPGSPGPAADLLQQDGRSRLEVANALVSCVWLHGACSCKYVQHMHNYEVPLAGAASRISSLQNVGAGGEPREQEAAALRPGWALLRGSSRYAVAATRSGSGTNRTGMRLGSKVPLPCCGRAEGGDGGRKDIGTLVDVWEDCIHVSPYFLHARWRYGWGPGVSLLSRAL